MKKLTPVSTLTEFDRTTTIWNPSPAHRRVQGGARRFVVSVGRDTRRLHVRHRGTRSRSGRSGQTSAHAHHRAPPHRQGGATPRLRSATPQGQAASTNRGCPDPGRPGPHHQRLTMLTERAAASGGLALCQRSRPQWSNVRASRGKIALTFQSVRSTPRPGQPAGWLRRPRSPSATLRPLESRPIDASSLAMATDCFPPPSFVRKLDRPVASAST